MRIAWVAGLIAGLLGALDPTTARAQTFDAVSVKESQVTGDANGGMQLLPNGDIRVRHLPPRFLIALAHRVPLANIIQLVASQIGGPIVDETRLSGAFDVTLRWSSENQSNDDAPVISTALQEQLGLKLVRRQVPIEAFVVDRIERPGPD